MSLDAAARVQISFDADEVVRMMPDDIILNTQRLGQIIVQVDW